jgi:hypothetical protein
MSSRQFDLFGARPLFTPQALGRFRSGTRALPVPNADAALAWMKDWRAAVRPASPARRRRSKETSLEFSFNTEFFERLLGYTLYPGRDGRCSAWPKPDRHSTGLDGESPGLRFAETPLCR